MGGADEPRKDTEVLYWECHRSLWGTNAKGRMESDVDDAGTTTSGGATSYELGRDLSKRPNP